MTTKKSQHDPQKDIDRLLAHKCLIDPIYDYDGYPRANKEKIHFLGLSELQVVVALFGGSKPLPKEIPEDIAQRLLKMELIQKDDTKDCGYALQRDKFDYGDLFYAEDLLRDKEARVVDEKLKRLRIGGDER